MSLPRPSPTLLAAALAAALPAAIAAPGAAAPPAPAASEPTLAYTVTPRDTLIGLNRTLFASPQAWPEVARLNHLKDPNRITPGQVLQVPVRLLHSKQVPATLASTFGDVRVAGKAAIVGASVNVGDVVTTGAASTAVLKLADGSQVRLAPDSEGRLDEHRRFQVKATKAALDEGLVAGTLRLVRGSIEVFATKVLRARPLEVSTPTAVIGVRGTSYRVRNDVTPATSTTPEVDAAATEVLEGKVNAQVGGAQADVPAKFGAPLEAGKPPEVLPLPPAPDLAAGPAVATHLPLRFRVPGGAPLRVQAATDAAFDRIAVDLHVGAGDEVRLPGLADGAWHLRVRQISPEGLEGLDGVRVVEVRAHPEPPFPVEPVGGARRAVGPVDLRWTANPEAAAYRVEVARDAAFTQFAWTRDVTAPQATFDPPASAFGAPDGAWFWRVESLKADGTPGPTGETQAFTLRPVPRPPLGGLGPDGASIELRWGGRADQHVQVELAADADFRAVAARGTFDGLAGRLARPAAGTWFARYRLVEPDGYESAWSPPLRVEVPSNWHEAVRALFTRP